MSNDKFIRYEFTVKLFEEFKYLLYEYQDEKFTCALLCGTAALSGLAKFIKSEITTSDGITKTRWFLLSKYAEPQWHLEDKIAFEEAVDYLKITD